MNTLDQMSPTSGDETPLLDVPEKATPPSSLWTRILRVVDEQLVPTRALSSLSAFRKLVEHISTVARTETASATIEDVLDHSGYLQDLQDERSEEAQARIENLHELVSAAR